MNLRKQHAIFALILCLVSVSSNSSAVTIDMEGIAPTANISNETNSTNNFFGFNVFVASGHYIDSAWPDAGTIRAGNGTDYLGIDSILDVTITQANGDPFNILSFDATDVFIDGDFIPNLVFAVSGVLNGGGTVSQNFTTDADTSFETFVFDSSWKNLSSVTFTQANSHGAYDNIVVTAVPVPAAVWLFGGGLAFLIRVSRRKK